MRNSRTWVEISAERLRHNIAEFGRLIGGDVILCPAVKGNAYGHGMKEVAPIMVDAGADWLAVDSLAEAVELQESGVLAGGPSTSSGSSRGQAGGVPIYIMGYIRLDELGEAVSRGFRIVLYNEESFERLKKEAGRLGKPALVHLKLETGTNRQGVLAEELPAWIERLKGCQEVVLEGVCTHFANIEDTTDHSYAQLQLTRFREMVGMIEAGGLKPKYLHCANSAAMILFPETHFSLVRPGIAAYGLWPSRETFISARDKGLAFELRPVLTWKTCVAEVKNVRAGEPIAYGCTFRTTRDSRMAVLPVGYYNCYPRSLSNRSAVLIRGQRAPVRGRVMMNMMVVDVTDIPGVSLEDEVVLLGEQAAAGGGGPLERISAEELAEATGTINYEVTTRIPADIERRVV